MIKAIIVCVALGCFDLGSYEPYAIFAQKTLMFYILFKFLNGGIDEIRELIRPREYM